MARRVRYKSKRISNRHYNSQKGERHENGKKEISYW